MLKEKSLKLKLLLMVGALLVLILSIYMLVSFQSLQQAEQDIVSDVTEDVTNQIEQTVAAKTTAIGYEISNIINTAYTYPYQLSKQVQASIENKLGEPFTRDQAEALLSNTLTYAPTSSIYMQFEANQFDGLDEQFKEGFKHSVAGAGSFESYFVREDSGNISQVVIGSADEKHDATLDEFGNRAAEWYLCSKDSLKPCIATPYKYEIRPGYSELMTSLVTPIIANGSFRGVVGVDLNLPILQQKAASLKSSLYNGNSEVFIVSHSGFLAAATQYENGLARPFKEVFSDANTILGLGN